MVNKLFESGWISPGGEPLSGTLTLLAPAHRAAGSQTVGTVPFPVKVTAGAFAVENLPAGPYTVLVELFAGDDEVRINSDRRAYAIDMPDDGDHRLRDLFDLGVVAQSPAARLAAVANAWLADNVNTEVSDTLMTDLLGDPGSAARTVLDGAYAPIVETAVLTRDGNGRIKSAVENGVTVTYTRDSQGRIASETRNGKTTTYTRDGAGRVSGWSTL